MRLLHSAGGWRAFPGSFSGQLLPRRLSSGGFTSGLLGTSHNVTSPARLKTKQKEVNFILKSDYILALITASGKCSQLFLR